MLIQQKRLLVFTIPPFWDINIQNGQSASARQHDISEILDIILDGDGDSDADIDLG